MIRLFLRAGLSCAFASVLSLPALAHATLEVQQADAGSTYKAVLRIPHGCGTEATHAVRVQIPEGFFGVKPMPHAGWTLDTVSGPYAHTYVSHGTETKEGVTEISWSDGNLPNEWYDEFVFRGTLSDTLKPGSILYFPTTQVCDTAENHWTATAENKEGEPAPKLTISGGMVMDEHAGMTMPAPADAMPVPMGGSVTLGSLTLSKAFTRAMPPNAPTGGGFVTITNNGTESDRLVSASSPRATAVQIHEMRIDNNVMVMRELPDGIEIPAGATVSLAPGGLHLMFVGATKPFAEGEEIDVTLVFEKAGPVTLKLPVAALGATAMPMMKMN